MLVKCGKLQKNVGNSRKMWKTRQKMLTNNFSYGKILVGGKLAKKCGKRVEKCLKNVGMWITALKMWETLWIKCGNVDKMWETHLYAQMCDFVANYTTVSQFFVFCFLFFVFCFFFFRV